MYGGRVIDDFDRRIVQTYMDEYMGDFLFDSFQPFHFYHNETVDYVIPMASTRQEFIGKEINKHCLCRATASTVYYAVKATTTTLVHFINL